MTRMNAPRYTCRHCEKPIVPRLGTGRTTYWVHVPGPGQRIYYRRCTRLLAKVATPEDAR